MLHRISEPGSAEMEESKMNRSMVCAFLLVVVGVLFAPTSFASAQIVALGSSAVRGNIPENEMWPAVLEGMLRAKGSQDPCEECRSLGRYNRGVLARVSSDVPDGTKIVLLTGLLRRCRASQ